LTREGREYKKRHAIEKYKRKVGREIAGDMWGRFDPNLNFAFPAFAFSMNILIQIEIDINIIFPPPEKARYGYAHYSVDVYDPLAPLGVLVPDELMKQLYVYVIKHFIYPTWRGYKYSLETAMKFLYASLPVFTEFAPEPIWIPRFRKIEAWRNWSAYYDLSCFDVNIFPADEIFIRVTDDPESFGYPVSERTVRSDNLSSNLYDHAVYERAFYPKTVAPYREILLLTPNLYCYQPVFDVANFDHDNFLDVVVFDENILYDIIESFKQTQQPLYRQLVWLKGSERMKVMYAVQASYQHETTTKIVNAFTDRVSSPIQLGQLYAFAMDYAYQRKFMRLVEAENVIERYKRLGLEESLLRQVAQITSRK